MRPDLEKILDRCIDWTRAGKDPEEILREHPDAAEEVRSLLAIAFELGELPDVPPSIEGMMKVVARMSVQQEAKRPPPKRAVGLFSRPVLVRVAAIVLGVLLLGWGTVTASSNTVPGDLLYPIKLLTERVKFFVTVNQEDKVELRLVFSEERLKEAVKKYQKGKGVDRDLLEQMLEEARLAVEASEGFPKESRELLAARAAYASRYQQEVLSRHKAGASAEEQQVLARYAEMCGRRAAWMRRMCGCGAPQDGPSRARNQGSQRPKGWKEMCPVWPE